MTTSLDAKALAGLAALLDRQDILEAQTPFSRGMDRFDRDLFPSAFHPEATIAAGDFVGGPAEPGMVPTMPITFADVAGIHGNGKPSRSAEDPSYRRPLVNLREPNIPS